MATKFIQKVNEIQLYDERLLIKNGGQWHDRHEFLSAALASINDVLQLYIDLYDAEDDSRYNEEIENIQEALIELQFKIQKENKL